MKEQYLMAVTVTLVFSDEAHRDAWLENNGVLSRESHNREMAARADYDERKRSQNLVYAVGPIVRKA